MNDLDKAWEAINALGGWVADSDVAGKGYGEAIDAALAEIEKLGGMDPVLRSRAVMTTSVWQPIETAPKSGYVCVGTQFGNRWSFNHAWWDDETEEWTDVFGDHVLNPHVWAPEPPAQAEPRDY